MIIDELMNDVRWLRQWSANENGGDYVTKQSIADHIEEFIHKYEELSDFLNAITDAVEDDGHPDDVKEHEDFAHDNDYSQWEYE